MLCHNHNNRLIEKEMSISHKDFYRLLPYALKNSDYEIVDDRINISFANGNIQIEPGIEQERKIASLVLPVMHIVFIFTDLSTEEIKQFFADFDRSYQRGGG